VTGAISPEALLGATGIEGILSGDPAKITVGDKSKAEMMAREIRRSLVRFMTDLDDLRPIPKMKKFDYEKALNQITDAVVPADGSGAPTVKPALMEKIAGCFRPEDHDLAAGYMSNVQRVLPHLQTLLPINVVVTSAKRVNYDPSDSEISHFRRAYDVANDPMVVCRDMELGILVADQLLHLQACYPHVYENLQRQLGAAEVDAIARKKSWKLPWRQERIVQMVLGTDTLSEALAVDLQRSFIAQDQAKPGPAQPSASGISKIATMVQPQTQAVADGDLRK